MDTHSRRRRKRDGAGFCRWEEEEKEEEEPLAFWLLLRQEDVKGRKKSEEAANERCKTRDVRYLREMMEFLEVSASQRRRRLEILDSAWYAYNIVIIVLYFVLESTALWRWREEGSELLPGVVFSNGSKYQ